MPPVAMSMYILILIFYFHSKLGMCLHYCMHTTQFKKQRSTIDNFRLRIASYFRTLSLLGQHQIQMCEIRPLYLTLPQITPELSMYDGVSCVWSGNTVAKATEIHCMLLSRSAQTK